MATPGKRVAGGVEEATALCADPARTRRRFGSIWAPTRKAREAVERRKAGSGKAEGERGRKPAERGSGVCSRQTRRPLGCLRLPSRSTSSMQITPEAFCELLSEKAPMVQQTLEEPGPVGGASPPTGRALFFSQGAGPRHLLPAPEGGVSGYPGPCAKSWASLHCLCW